jgi:hypothetical protein
LFVSVFFSKLRRPAFMADARIPRRSWSPRPWSPGMLRHLGRLCQAQFERRLAAPGGTADARGGWPWISGGSGAIIERPRRSDPRAREERVSGGVRRRSNPAAGEQRRRRGTAYGAGGVRAKPHRYWSSYRDAGLELEDNVSFFLFFFHPPFGGILL